MSFIVPWFKVELVIGNRSLWDQSGRFPWLQVRCLGLGALLALTLPPSPLGFLAPLPLALLLAEEGFAAGFWAGIGFWGLYLSWLPESFVLLFHSWLGILPFLPLIALKALSWGILFTLSRRRPLLRIGLWIALEYLTSLGELAFPWGFLGYALVRAPGRILAAWGGVYLLSWVVLLVAYGLYRRRFWVILPWIALWFWPLPQAMPQHTALLIQGDINPLAKALGEENAQHRYLELTRQGLVQDPRADLVVWPETAVFSLPPHLTSLLGSRPLVSGLGTFDGGYRDRVVLVEEGKVIAYYDKRHLVPFGEFWPWRHLLGGIYGFFFHAFGFSDLQNVVPGKRYRLLGPYGAYICYESVFPRVARHMVAMGAQLLINVSNDAWFGPTVGVEQHFEMGRLRAVETGRWLLRAGNSGITASIDPYGRVVARLPASRPGVLEAPYAFRRGETPYVRFGNWAVLLALLVGLWDLRPRRAKL